LSRLEKFYSDLPEKKYDVALSFAGEQRDYVEKVAEALYKKGVEVFYDDYEEIDMWGQNLVTHLEDVFMNKAASVVIFVSKEYAEKAYPRLEKDAAVSTAINLKTEYILPARFDDTRIPGISPTLKYIDLRKITAEKFALKIVDKLKQMRII
jgi:hypothetical protein